MLDKLADHISYVELSNYLVPIFALKMQKYAEKIKKILCWDVFGEQHGL